MSKVFKAIKKIALHFENFEEPDLPEKQYKVSPIDNFNSTFDIDRFYSPRNVKEQESDEYEFLPDDFSEDIHTEFSPLEYSPCPQCGFDHSSEKDKAEKAHETLEPEFWDQYFPTKSAQYSGWSQKKPPITTPMPPADISMKTKPSHIDLPEMPKTKSRQEIVKEMQDLLQELKYLDEE